MRRKATLFLLFFLSMNTFGQNGSAPSAGSVDPKDKGTTSTLRKQSSENGITVGRTKVFDNRTLTLMLESLSDTLRGVQVIDQDPLKKALGLLQGSQTQDVSRSFSVLAGGTPKIVTSNNASAEADTDNQLTLANGTKDDKATKDYIQRVIDQKLTGKVGSSRDVTTSERNPALPSLPDLIAAPSGAP